jgi:hypothetical protein
MFRPALSFMAILTLLLGPDSSSAQQAEAPVYQNGDWWRVKVDVVRPPGVSVSGKVIERFPEYIVKFESNQPRVFGVRGNESEQVSSQAVTALVLGRPAWLGEMLRFPLRVGLTWSDRVKFQPPGIQMRLEDAKYEVPVWEKIKTPKGEFDAFKIVMTMRAPGPKPLAPGEIRTHTYYYAPDVKAIVSLDTSGSARVASMLIDFSLAK